MRRNRSWRMAKPRAISLFSGCGGSDLAVQDCGFNIVWANDVWDVACQTYRDNIPNAKIEEGDIRCFDKFPDADLLFGCYPCQGYSQGGRRNPDEPINYLYQEFDRVLRQIRPKAFVVENVIGMAYGKNKMLLMNQVYRFRMAGYRVTWAALDAKDFGVAQTRRRVFIVGIRSDLGLTYAFPAPTYGPARNKPYTAQSNVIKGLPKWPNGEFNAEGFHWYYLSRNRRQPWGKPAPCIVGHWRHVPYIL